MAKCVWTSVAGSMVLMAACAHSAQAQEAQQTATSEQVDALQKQVEALQAQLDVLKKQVPKALPNWRGAPQITGYDGWSFKPRGRIHYDVGYIAPPGSYSVNRSLGFNSRIRRVRLGAEGSMPGGFGYKIEADFANGNVAFGNVFTSWTNQDKDVLVRVGNFETLNGLDQITSSNYITFLERGQMNDAFSNARRLGAAAALIGKDHRHRIEAGLFTAHGIDASFDNDGWIGAARGVYAPQISGGRLHLALNYQHRVLQQNNGGSASASINAPSINQVARYRARPFLQTTDVRFVDTGSFAAKRDGILGLELAAIFPKIYVASEAQWARVRTYRPGDLATGLDAFANPIQATPRQDPRFFGGYVEFGYFLTGETRGYRDNNWGRTRVLNPLSKGGGGAWQIAARLDYLDLNSQALKTAPLNNFSTGVSTPASPIAALGRGGKQTGAIFGLNWYPSDYIRIMMNYVRINVDGGPFAATVVPSSTALIDQRGYSTDAFAIRTQLDF